MTYATIDDISRRMLREFGSDEETMCESLLEDAAVIIDSVAPDAPEEKKKVVSCRMVMRALGSGDDYGVPLGASQGSTSALGYSQSWTMSSSGGAGELYLSKMEKKLLGIGNRIGSYSPVQDLIPEGCFEAMP